MSGHQRLPKPEDVSVDDLIKPTPPSHEFRFRITTVLIVVTIIALVLALVRLAMVS